MNTNQSATMYESVPVVSELNKVQGFDPLKFLRRTTKGEKVLDLKYKKLWFRLKYPNGRIKLSSLKITDQLAIIEARVYFDKNDAQPRSSFIAQREAKATLGGLYIESAQHAAIDQALSDAGFGVQFSAAAPAVNAEKAAETVKEQTTVAETATTEQVTPAAPVTVAEVATEVNNEPAQEALAVQETVAEVPTAEVMEPLAPVTEEAEGEEIEEETADTDTAAPTYSADMIFDLYSQIDGCTNETVIWLGEPKPPKELRKRFGTVKAIREADETALAAVLPQNVAHTLWIRLHEKEST